MRITSVAQTLVSEYFSASSHLTRFVVNNSCARTHVQLFGEGSESFAGKAVNKRLHEWTNQEMRMMLSWGNLKANTLWGGKMTEEQATEEGRLEFIHAKYFEREFGMPELEWYTNVEIPITPDFEGVFPEDYEEWDGKEKYIQAFEKFAINPAKIKGPARRRVAARRVSVSSSESDGDIRDVLKEVVRDYEETHGRTTRVAERAPETHASSTTGIEKDLIDID